MKTRKVIYISIGVLLIVLNLLVDLVSLSENDFSTKGSGNIYNAVYFIGAHFFLIIGIIFLRMAYKLHRKIKSAVDNNLEDSINSIGKS